MRRKSTRGKNPWADHYTRQAQKEHFPARSVYKLKEIQQKYRLIKRGDRVLDLGCAPGSWLLYAAEIAGPDGLVVGIDLKPVTVQLPANARFYAGDIETVTAAFEQAGEVGRFDVVLSDMAPATIGHKATDAVRSLHLCEAALDIVHTRLVPGGNFATKIFQGPDFKTYSDKVKAGFRQVKIYKPQSSRKASKEIYIIGTGKL
jgi:23S rRNA (uridine2552-2'-O)-methyltransferase